MAKPKRNRSAAYKFRRKIRRARRAMEVKINLQSHSENPYLLAMYNRASRRVIAALRDPQLRFVFP